MREAGLGLLGIAAIAGLAYWVYWAQPELTESTSPVLDELRRVLAAPAGAPDRSAAAPRNPWAWRGHPGPPGGFRLPAQRPMGLDKNGDKELTDDELLFSGHSGFGGLGPPAPRGFGGPGGPGFGNPPAAPGPGGPWGTRKPLELLGRFDQDKDGVLNRQK